ncbi:MAG: ABC transporter ATP-binding protein [Clostridia bacterium]|nr:ABC transporter ATP-binding protein [Clostridia bacterium]
MIQCEKLSRRYGQLLALDQLDLHVDAGEVHGFVGPNGAGKSTAMRIFATLLSPTSGRAMIGGVDVAADPEAARKVIGYMPDFFGVYDNLKAWEYLDLYAGCMRISAKARRRRIDELLDMTGMRDKRERYVDDLSRGMKQRLCLCRAMLHDPELLILDEPASGMDPRSRAEMRDILREIGRTGKTVLISSHILPELSELCSSMSILDKGKLVFSGQMDELEKKIHAAATLVIEFDKALDDAERELAAEVCRRVTGAEAAMDEGRCRIDMPEDRAQDAALLRDLIGAGLRVCACHRDKATLEDVFMEVIRE